MCSEGVRIVLSFPPRLSPSIRITEDLEEQSNVKDVVLSHYVTLVEVFKHYASVGSALATGEIDIMEARDPSRESTQMEGRCTAKRKRPWSLP